MPRPTYPRCKGFGAVRRVGRALNHWGQDHMRQILSGVDERWSTGEVDVTGWAFIRDEPGGRDAYKRWVALRADASRDEHWLWKARQRTAGGSERALTDCAEVVVSRLAAMLRIPAADCRFAVLDGELGVISRNVSPPGFSLNVATTYLPEVPGYWRRPPAPQQGDGLGRMRLDEGYTLDAVEQVLADVAPPPGIAGQTAFASFAGYLVLDALVANTDRHPGNWAILEGDRDGRRFLAPTYDHGSALGAGLTDENRRSKSVAAFARRGIANPFAPPGQALVDLACEAVRRSGATVWLDRVAALDDDAVREKLVAPSGRLSDVASKFMFEVIMENRRRLCHVNSVEG